MADKVSKIFERFAETWAAIPGAGRSRDGGPAAWIVGFSGGLDSTVLLDLCWRYREERDGRQIIIAAHLNHGLRGEESEADEAFCRDFSAERRIAYRQKKEDVRRLAAERKIGLEEAGRFARHRFFDEICNSYKNIACHILLGHHADDQAETVLMNILRGTGLRGLAGMEASVSLFGREDDKALICRPLLGLHRPEVLAYARERGLAWRDDSSNADRGFLRNRLRHEVLPLFENMRPHFTHRLLALATAAREATSALSQQGAALWRASQKISGGGILLRLPDGCPLAIVAEAINYGLEREFCRKRMRAADYVVLSRLMTLAAKSAKGEIANGILLRREPQGILLSQPSAPPHPLSGEGEMLLPPAPPFTVQGLGVQVTAETRPLAAGEAASVIPPAERDNPGIGWFDADRVRWPLRLRTRRSGDRFHPLGAPGNRKVKKILCDAKMTTAERNATRLLCDEDGIIWLWPFRIGHRCCLTAASKTILRVKIEPLFSASSGNGCSPPFHGP